MSRFKINIKNMFILICLIVIISVLLLNGFYSFGGFIKEGFDEQLSVVTIAGSGARGSADGNGKSASFGSTFGIAVDSNGNIYISDTHNRKVRKITPSGDVRTLAGSNYGFADGSGSSASFTGPWGISVDSTGNMYAADSLNNRIRKITPNGDVSTFAGTGTAGSSDGPGSSATFNNPTGITIDNAGNLYVTDLYSQKIRKITPSGDVSTVVTFNEYYYLSGITIDSSNNLYVTDVNNHIIRKITPSGEVSKFAGSGSPGSNDGPASSATFNFPNAIAVDSTGNLYVTDSGSFKIRKITPSGLVSTFAGNGTKSTVDGPLLSSSFFNLWGIATDSNNNIYVADTYTIRKIGTNAPKPQPIACQVGEWSDWGNCTKTCGGGIQTRNRAILSEAQSGGQACPNLTEEKPCNDQPCNVDCVSTWENVGEPFIDPTTKKKMQKQSYKILTPPSGSGVQCAAENGAIRTIEADQNCEPGEWAPWSDCSATCGGGKQTRTRTIMKEKSGNGSVAGCDPLTEERTCNTQACAPNVPNVDCAVTEWSEWSACDAACNQVGTSTRTAKSTIPKSGSGADCVMTQTKSCSGVQCPVAPPPPPPPPPPTVQTTCRTVSGFKDYTEHTIDSSGLLLPSNSPYRPQGSVFSLSLFNRK
jgi:sugar lactone lactonase YvrE